MQNRFCLAMLLAFCGTLATGHAANALNLTSDDKVSIQCCDLLEKLGKYTIHASGDQVPMDLCKKKEEKCLTLNLIQLFLKQKNAFLKNSNTGNAVQTSNTEIVLDKGTILDNALDLLVFSFLGLSVATQQGLFDQHMSLEYDSILDKLTVRDSACLVNKTVYSAIVMASIALVVFFIVMQIIEEQKTEQIIEEQKTEHHKTEARDYVDNGSGNNNSTKPQEMRMPCGPNLQSLLRIRPLQQYTGRGHA
jgi:hypothetical protein